MHLKPTPCDPAGFLERSAFWMALSGVYGASRIVAGYTLWRMMKLCAALSVATLTAAPAIYPFGVIDPIFAIIVLAYMFYACFGREKLTQQ